MLQAPLPLMLVVSPEDVSGSTPALPLQALFDLQERVQHCFFIAHAGERLPLEPDKDIRALLHCQITDLPLEAPKGQDGPEGKLILHNQGDEFGESGGKNPLTCPPQVLRDLRDLAAAHFADWPGRVGLNFGRSKRFFTEPPKAGGIPWVRLEFSSSLWQTPGGGLLERRVKEFSSRLQAMLTLWCRLQAW